MSLSWMYTVGWWILGVGMGGQMAEIMEQARTNTFVGNHSLSLIDEIFVAISIVGIAYIAIGAFSKEKENAKKE